MEWPQRENAPTSESQTRTSLVVCALGQIGNVHAAGKFIRKLEKLTDLESSRFWAEWKMQCLDGNLEGKSQGSNRVQGSWLWVQSSVKAFGKRQGWVVESTVIQKGGGFANTKKVWMSPHFQPHKIFEKTTSWVYLPNGWLPLHSPPSDNH